MRDTDAIITRIDAEVDDALGFAENSCLPTGFLNCTTTII